MAIVCLSVAIGFLLGQERVIGWEMQAGKEFLTMFLKISQRLAEFSRKIGESLWRYRNIARHSLHLHCHSNPNSYFVYMVSVAESVLMSSLEYLFSLLG